ncbi:MAG: GNAT family N-acetyltransferase [Micrococcales bacterium]|nr:GNAT family N-acetyltransferase [Micrococcales bacterium]
MSFLDDALEAISPALIEAASPEQLDQMLDMQSLTWGEPVKPDAKPWLTEGLDWSRSFLAVADSQPVGFVAAWGFNVPVPGGRVDTAGLTWVGVHPGYRRRGLLRALMAKHFEDTLSRGEPVSMLFASEPEIYSRFGYGVAARSIFLTLPRGATLREVPGSDQVVIKMATATYDKHGAVVQSIMEQAGQGPMARPGWTTVPNQGELRNFFYNTNEPYPKEEVTRIALAYTDGQPTGYALFKRDHKWVDWTPSATLTIQQLVALDPASHHRLWSTLINMDLQAKVAAGHRPIDDEVLALLENPRQADGKTVDTLHVRILDLPAALAARGYAVPINVVMDISDPQFPQNAGRWRLMAGLERQTVIVRDAESTADLELSIRDLGAIYLGGPSLAWLVGAGVVKENTPGAAIAVSQAFKSAIEPATPNDW